MKKNIILIVALIALQIMVLFVGIWISVFLSSSCSFIADEVGMWQCSSNAGFDPIVFPLAAFIVLPPFLAKFILAKLGREFSWERIFITHIIVALLVWTVLYTLDPINNCGCGGA